MSEFKLTALGLGPNGNVDTRLLRDDETTAEAIEKRYPMWFAERVSIVLLEISPNGNIVHVDLIKHTVGV